MMDVDGVLIHDDLKAQLEPVGFLQEHPDNPRRGAVERIADSIAANGVYRAIVVQKSTGYILSGNHTYRAMVGAGAKRVPVTWVEVDDDGAKRILLSDNRTSEFGSIDQADLLAILNDLDGTDAGLIGSGYADFDLDDLAVEMERLTPQGLAQLADDQAEADAGAAAATGVQIEGAPPNPGSGYAPDRGVRLDASRRIMVFDFPLDTFVYMTDALAQVCDREGLETNQDAVLHLVRAYLG